MCRHEKKSYIYDHMTDVTIDRQGPAWFVICPLRPRGRGGGGAKGLGRNVH